MKRILFILCLFFSWQLAYSARIIPADMVVAVIKDAQYPTVVLKPNKTSISKILTLGIADGAKGYQMSPVVKIKDEQNRYIVHGQLPRHKGKPVVVRFDANLQVIEIWLLTAAELHSIQ